MYTIFIPFISIDRCELYAFYSQRMFIETRQWELKFNLKLNIYLRWLLEFVFIFSCVLLMDTFINTVTPTSNIIFVWMISLIEMSESLHNHHLICYFIFVIWVVVLISIAFYVSPSQYVESHYFFPRSDNSEQLAYYTEPCNNFKMSFRNNSSRF